MWNVAAAVLVPRFPVSGPLRLLAISGTLSLVAFLWAAYLCHRKGPRDQSAWATAPVVLAFTSIALGRIAPALHPVATGLTLLAALRNIIRFRGVPRILEAIGAISWIVSVLAARALFS